MAELDERPFPPGEYPVVVVGSGPGGLQTSYCLRRLGIEHAVVSQDDSPGGMFRKWPIYQRLLSWTKPDAPVERGTRAYEWYDHNSLLGEESGEQALVAEFMDRTWMVPSRPEMEQGLAAFADRAGVPVRYGCRWESTRREEDGFVLATSDGEYRCKVAVFAIGVTDPLKMPIPGHRERPALRRDREGARLRGQARRRDRQTELGLRDRGRDGPVGEAGPPRLAAARRRGRSRYLHGSRPLPPALRGPFLGRRHVRPRRCDRADRQDNGRLPHRRERDDVSGRDGDRR